MGCSPGYWGFDPLPNVFMGVMGLSRDVSCS